MSSSFSVALCTYNGEKHIAAQLESIAGQSRLPEELIICDDGSQDATLEIVHRFAKSAPFPVQIEENERNLGSTANFSKAIALCRHPWIVLSDQDDLWLPDKLSTFAKQIEMVVHVGAIFSDAEMIWEDLSPIRYTLWQAVGFSSKEQNEMKNGNGFSVLLRRNIITGATLAFQAKYRDLIQPIPSEWVHDGWIALLISIFDTVLPIDTPLIRYRQHPAQQLGEKKRSLYEQYLIGRQLKPAFFQETSDMFQLVKERLDACQHGNVPENVMSDLDQKIEHWQTRANLRNSILFRLPIVLRELISGRYAKYSLGWKSAAQDLLL